MPVARAPATIATAAFRSSPPLATAPPPATTPPVSKNCASDVGSGTTASDRSADALSRKHRDPDRVGDLGVRATFELAHDEGGALVERQSSERVQDALYVRPIFFRHCNQLDVLLERNLLNPTARPRIARACNVVRDLDQPVLRLLHLDALAVCAVRIQERRLRDVLSVGRIAQKRERVVIDVLDVLPVERLEGLISS